MNAAIREAIAALRHTHQWLEEHERLNGPDPQTGRRRGYIGLDHPLGANDDACTACHAVAALEGRVEPIDVADGET